MRRKPGALMPVELAILSAILSSGAGDDSYGYAIARAIQADQSDRTLTSHGTLYKALDRLVKAGLLSSRWEDPEISATEERPRRRLYRVTAEGERAYQVAVKAPSEGSLALREGLQPS